MAKYKVWIEFEGSVCKTVEAKSAEEAEAIAISNFNCGDDDIDYFDIETYKLNKGEK